MHRGVQCALVMGVVRWGGADRFHLDGSFVGFPERMMLSKDGRNSAGF